nr:MAG TPA: hypothetical protein [Caudoviricetes sp.]
MIFSQKLRQPSKKRKILPLLEEKEYLKNYL